MYVLAICHLQNYKNRRLYRLATAVAFAFFADASLTFARHFNAVSNPPRNSSRGDDVNGAERQPSSSSSDRVDNDVNDMDGLMIAAVSSNSRIIRVAITPLLVHSN